MKQGFGGGGKGRGEGGMRAVLGGAGGVSREVLAMYVTLRRGGTVGVPPPSTKDHGSNGSPSSLFP